MRTILFVGSSDDASKNFIKAIEKPGDFKTLVAKDGQEALRTMKSGGIDVVVVDAQAADGTGLTLLRQLVIAAPLLNFAAISAMDHEAFHEATEGLGVFMQLPPNPGKKEAEKMRQLLDAITSLLGQVPQQGAGR